MVLRIRYVTTCIVMCVTLTDEKVRAKMRKGTLPTKLWHRVGKETNDTDAAAAAAGGGGGGTA